MHDPIAFVLQFFKYEHLKSELQVISRPFAELAQQVAGGPKNPETTAALRKLLEAKDCAVRAVLAKDDTAAVPKPEPEPPPADWSKRDVVGTATAPGVPDTDDRGDGQQKGYVVLSDEERARGFVRPVRSSYRHVGPPDAPQKGCGTVTTMGLKIAETYARDPRFYNGTFCAGCNGHFPVGEKGEFVWEEPQHPLSHKPSERVGT